MTTLVTGGTGKTGSLVARLLHDAGYPLVAASRKGIAPEPLKAAKLDYDDPTTFENPFIADPNIDRVYLVTPDVEDQLGAVRPFIDFALKKGVKRIVYVGSSAPLEAKLYSPVWEYILTLGIDYTILRPTWFIGTFHIDASRRSLIFYVCRELFERLWRIHPSRKLFPVCSSRRTLPFHQCGGHRSGRIQRAHKEREPQWRFLPFGA